MNFRAALEQAHKQVTAKGQSNSEHTQMVTSVLANPTMMTRSGERVLPLRILERKVKRMYLAETGKRAEWIPIGIIVLFIISHWSTIMAVLKGILAVLKKLRGN